MDFIFMLTQGDRTVPDCLDVVARIAALGLGHIGFKDVGVEAPTLAALNAAIKATGATSYMEVVSESREATLASARTARAIGVDRLLGGTDVDAVMTILAGSAIRYYPFVGFPEGHPTALRGGPADVEAHCRRAMAKGAAGVDLLAYRAVEAEPLALVAAAREGLGEGRLVVAGSIDSAARIGAVAAAGADAFTIGSAIFDGSFAPGEAAIEGRLRRVLGACA